MKLRSMPESTEELYRKNSDFPGYRVVLEDNQENVSYSETSNVRIWYNNIPAVFSEHWHDAIEMILPEENWYDLTSEGVTYRLEPGDIAIVPSRVMHSLNAPETGARYIYLVNVEPFTLMKDYSTLRPLMTHVLIITQKTEPKIYETIRHLLHRARETYFNNEDFSEMSIYTMMSDIMTTIGRDRLSKLTPPKSIKSGKNGYYIERFNDMLDYINTHYAEELTLESAAEHCGFSKCYFSKLFKEYSNMTFLDYLNYKRISAAEEQLLTTAMSVTEVALASGFTSISNFNRSFRLSKGCSPTKFREMYGSK